MKTIKFNDWVKCYDYLNYPVEWHKVLINEEGKLTGRGFIISQDDNGRFLFRIAGMNKIIPKTSLFDEKILNQFKTIQEVKNYVDQTIERLIKLSTFK